jgi:hypothetical protein
MVGSFMGERARNRGAEAENKTWRFLESLGYRVEERNNEQYDIDGLVRFLPNIHGGFTRPRYAPDGLTAFEVTVETLRRKKVTDFRDKILRYNAANPTRIEGGVLVIEDNISPRMITFMKDEGVWGWGHSRQSLYKAKLQLYNAWKEIGNTSEISIDETTSILRCSTPPPTISDKLLRFGVFVDDDFTTLSLRKVTEIMSRIREGSINPLISLGVIPLNVHFEFHSVGGYTISDENFEENIVEPWRVDGINILGKCVFSDYRTLPAM